MAIHHTEGFVGTKKPPVENYQWLIDYLASTLPKYFWYKWSAFFKS